MKLDLGCGKNKREGFYGVDAMKFDCVDLVLNLAEKPPKEMPLEVYEGLLTDADYFHWPWKDEEVEEAHCSHFIEHLTWPERVHFFNELYRVLKKDAKCQLILPHWNSQRYYGDPTHKEPMSEFAFYYLDKAWREQNAPHTGYTCDFNVTWGYSLRGDLLTKHVEAQQFALANYKDAAQDIIATLTRK